MRLLLAFVALCLAAPAPAGQRAVYLSPDGDNLTVEVADNGNAVIRPTKSKEYGIYRDGQFYLVGQDKGQWKVARLEDLAAAFDQLMPPVFEQLFGAMASASQGSKLRIERRGTRKVAGFEGIVFAVHGLDSDKPDAAHIFVLSTDPKLAPVGKAMEQFLISSVVAMRPLLGELAAAMAADMRAIFANGAPLDAEGKFKLDSLVQVDLPDSNFALPAPPQTAAQIVAEMKAGMPAEASN
jgi:hypothetical protein